MISFVSASTRALPTKRSRFAAAVHVLPALLFLILTKAPSFCHAHEADFEESMYSLALEGMHEEEKEKIGNIDIDGLGNLLDVLVTLAIVNTHPSKDSSMTNLFAFSFLWKDPFDPVPDCTDQSFGFEGQWTDAICNTIETLREACDTQESSCDPEAFQTVVAGTGDIIQASTTKLALASCLFDTKYVFELCQDPAVLAVYETRINDLIGAVTYFFPDGFENVLLTNFVGEYATDYIEDQMNTTTGSLELMDQSDSNFFIGDGRFKMNSKIFNHRSAHESIMAKSYAVKSVVFQYTYPLTARDLVNGLTFKNDITYEQYHFYEGVLTGYFFQEYADDLLNKWERKSTVQVMKKVSYTGCGEILGILAASRCGYKADGLLGLVEYYFSTLPEARPSDENSTEYVCSRFKWNHAKRANKAMTTTGTKLNRPNPVRSHERCIEVLKLTE